MTTQTITTFVAAGYVLAAQYDTLDITTTGGVGGTGLLLSHLATLRNDGTIAAAGGANGVHATAGGTFVNGSAAVTTASISGYSGVFAQNAAATVVNFGTVAGNGRFGDGVFLTEGGRVTNGSASAIGATIRGVNSGVSAAGAAAKVTNFRLIRSHYSNAVDLAMGGTVTNGSGTDEGAQIISDEGTAIDVRGGIGTITNFGFVGGQDSPTTQSGVYLEFGGRVTNGSASDTIAEIKNYGGDGVYIKSGYAVVTNYALIQSYKSDGIHFEGLGSMPEDVTNGGATDTTALILGATDGIYFDNTATLNNFGTIVGAGALQQNAGVYVARVATVTNGSAADTKAIIQGSSGIILDAGFVSNFGTIAGTTHYGVFFNRGGA